MTERNDVPKDNATGPMAKSLALIETEMDRLLPPGGDRLAEAMRYAAAGGGKRFRPLLVLGSAEAFAVEPAAALPFACAVELIHSYSLVHDDLPCMDDDDMRRGQPSCHKAFGEDIALLAGDALLTLAFEVMAAADLPAALRGAQLEIIREVGVQIGRNGMIGGQMLDITFQAARPQGLMDLMKKKTGALITVSARVGALLGRAPAAKLRAVTEYGEAVGLAFQIRDDIFDISERSKKNGQDKPNFAALSGMADAKKQLEASVGAALDALDLESITAPSLGRLARMLLKF
jgi:geranylgeranyl diphosphate synthase type II